jgi:predicted flap endonuclease-1-like 5' DNA nuclease
MGEKVRAFGKLPQILTFPFKGEGWFGKIAIAALIMVAGGIIPVLPGIILLGYFYEMVRRIVVDGEDASLPKWEDWGGFLSNGFKWFASTLVVTLPFVLIFLVTMALYFVPIFFINEGTSDFMGGYFAFLFILQFVTIFASMIFMVFMGVFAPVYMTHMVAKGEFKSMFQIKQWWKVFTKGFWEFLISFLLMYGLGMIIYFIFFVLLYSVVCCCLAPFAIGFGTVYLMAVYFALVASAYRDGRNKVPAEDEPLPLDEGSVEEAESLPEPDGVVEEVAALEPDEPSVEEIAAATGVTAALSLPEEAVSEEVEEYDIPSPDVEAVEEEERTSTADVESTIYNMEAMEKGASADATIVSGVNANVAAAMGFAEATIKMDDLKKISGIGPKTADVLRQAGIMNFEQLSKTSEETLRQILIDNGLEIVAAACGDWPKQAKDLM